MPNALRRTMKSSRSKDVFNVFASNLPILAKGMDFNRSEAKIGMEGILNGIYAYDGLECAAKTTGVQF